MCVLLYYWAEKWWWWWWWFMCGHFQPVLSIGPPCRRDVAPFKDDVTAISIMNLYSEQNSCSIRGGLSRRYVLISLTRELLSTPDERRWNRAAWQLRGIDVLLAGRFCCFSHVTRGIMANVSMVMRLRYDTIRDAILTCVRKPTWVGLIYRTEAYSMYRMVDM